MNPHGVTRLILSQVRLPFRHPGISLVPGTWCFSAWHKKNYTITNGIVKYFFENFYDLMASRDFFFRIFGYNHFFFFQMGEVFLRFGYDDA